MASSIRQICNTKAGECLPLFVAEFPNTFLPWRTDPVRLLKVGTYKDIRQRVPYIGARKVFAVLWAYTRTRRYLESLVEGVPRVDLDGNAAGIVTKQEAEHAKHRLKLLLQHRAKVAAVRTAAKSLQKEPQPSA